jgi:hypothetical protein
MKRIILPFIFGILTLIACEDVIEVDLETSKPKLVIDASLGWVKGTLGNAQEIRLSLTAPFFDTNIPPATGATVTVMDENNNVFNFTEKENTGKYRSDTFKPLLNSKYSLKIEYNNEIYTAEETFIPVVPIEGIEQRNDVGFSGDEKEIKAFFTDPKDEKNWYLMEFINPETEVRSPEIYDDEFTNGNRTFGVYFDDDLKKGDTLLIANEGISKSFFEYVNILLQQIDDENGDPFQTQPATVRGNCINETNPDNFPLGYFRASEVSLFIYTIE